MQKYGMQNYTSCQIGGQTQISLKIGLMEFAIKFLHSQMCKVLHCKFWKCSAKLYITRAFFCYMTCLLGGFKWKGVQASPIECAWDVIACTTKPWSSSNSMQIKFVKDLKSVSVTFIIPKTSRTPTSESTKCWFLFCIPLELNRSTMMVNVSACFNMWTQCPCCHLH